MLVYYNAITCWIFIVCQTAILMSFKFSGRDCCKPSLFWHTIIYFAACSRARNVPPYKLIWTGLILKELPLFIPYELLFMVFPEFNSKYEVIRFWHFVCKCTLFIGLVLAEYFLQEDFNTWNYWKLPSSAANIWTSLFAFILFWCGWEQDSRLCSSYNYIR